MTILVVILAGLWCGLLTTISVSLLISRIIIERYQFPFFSTVFVCSSWAFMVILSGSIGLIDFQ